MAADAPGRRFLIDLSAWARSGHPDAVTRWTALLADDRLLAHPMFAVELLHNGADSRRYRQLRDAIENGFDWVWPDEETARIAIRIQERMASTAPAAQRVKTVDVFTAALASQHRLGVLHYDRDYDVIADRGGEPFHNIWLAERGKLEGAGSGARVARSAYQKALAVPPQPNL